MRAAVLIIAVLAALVSPAATQETPRLLIDGRMFGSATGAVGEPALSERQPYADNFSRGSDSGRDLFVTVQVIGAADLANASVRLTAERTTGSEYEPAGQVFSGGRRVPKAIENFPAVYVGFWFDDLSCWPHNFRAELIKDGKPVAVIEKFVSIDCYE